MRERARESTQEYSRATIPGGGRVCHGGRVGVIASVDSAALAVEPGAEVSRDVRVQNTGMVVDQILLDVLGEAQPWATIQPKQLNLLPGADATARLTFRPPRASAPLAGSVPYAVRVMSVEDPDGSTIEEGVVEVAPFVELTAEVVPKTAEGRRRARFRLMVENKGNLGVSADISATDPDLALEFRARPAFVAAAPGTATFVRLQASAKKRFLRGPSKSRPFQALVQADGCPPASATGTMLQQQILPEWLLPAIAVVMAAAAVLVALWFTVLKPEVQSAATAAVAKAAAPLKASAAKANQAAESASQAAQKANSAAGTASTGATKTGAGGSGAGGAAGAGAGTPVSDMLQANAPPTTSATFKTLAYTKIPAKHVLNVTDIVVLNPLGDTGIMQIRAGNTVLLTFGLANFRSNDYHLAQPMVFTSASPPVLAVECKNPGTTNCTAGFFFDGTLLKS